LHTEQLEKMLVKLHIRSTQPRHLTRGWFCSLVTNEGSGGGEVGRFCTASKLVGLIRCKNETCVMNVVFDKQVRRCCSRLEGKLSVKSDEEKCNWLTNLYAFRKVKLKDSSFIPM
jgi:hypothetical protein